MIDVALLTPPPGTSGKNRLPQFHLSMCGRVTNRRLQPFRGSWRSVLNGRGVDSL